MIIIGYQGIGKSTLAGVDNKYIDLESSNFFVDGKRGDDWYRVYANIAEHLSKQGYVVFTSSHEVVREALRNSDERVLVAAPCIHLKEKWIKKLEHRYETSGLEKDYKAYMNAKCMYEDNIISLADYACSFDNPTAIVIKTLDYNLKELINEVCKK